MRRASIFILLIGLIATIANPLTATAQAKPLRPKEFAIIFNMGYAGDHLPKDKESFTKLIKGLKQASFNVVLCKYTDERAEVCKKHSMLIMPDLLVSDYHVYKNVKGAQTLCMNLRGKMGIFAYHLWSDRIGGTAAGRSRDAANVQQWDPTHPTYVGSYNGRSLEGVKNPHLIGYYDFHWRRGGHWRHLLRMQSAAKKTNSYFLRYLQPDPGRVGAGNYNRVLYTVSTSIAFGLKGYTYHYRGGTLNPKTGELGALGKDLAKVNAEYAPVGSELIKLGNPQAVYSTPITKTAKNRPTGNEKPIVPAELKPIPANAPFQVAKGEALIGVYRDQQKNDVLFLANHNAYETQKMELRISGTAKSVTLFNRQKVQWQSLSANGGIVRFEIPPAAGELVRITR